MKNSIKYLDRVFNGRDLTSGKVVIQNSIANDELAIDTLDFTAQVQDSLLVLTSDGYIILGSDDYALAKISDEKPQDMVNYTYGADVTYHHDGDLIGKFYMNNVKRVGKYQYAVSCISAIGLLDNSRHYGGIYTGALMKNVVSDIIGGIVPYTISEQFQNVQIYGWLPIGTRRESLQQILFATGASLKKDVAGAIHIAFLDVKNPYDISDNRVYIGGNVNLKKPITSAVVTEHGYVKSDSGEVVTLYDGMVAGDKITSPNGTSYAGALVTFTDPCHSLTVSGGSILEQGPNYAVLAQSAFSKLTGKKYVHTTKEITKKQEKRNARTIVDIKDNIATVSDATLVTLANSENVAKRVLAYYSATKQISASIVVGKERPGDSVTFADPFDDKATGFVDSMDISISNVLKAQASISVGYVPSDPGNFYKNSVLLTGSGTWKVPAGTTKIRVVLFDGGNGGARGGKGQDGSQGNGDTHGTSGAGGVAGAGGIGGKIYETEFNVTPTQQFQYKSGLGGSQGSVGGSTSFGTYNSSDGSLRPQGYVDLFTGSIYAVQGSPGLNGGRGRDKDGGYESVPGGYPGLNGADDIATNYGAYGYGGLGGGAAYYASGADGGGGYQWHTALLGDPKNMGHGGNGGTGGSVTYQPPASANIGSGGTGGYGGGGGGGGGGGKAKSLTIGGINYRADPKQGLGGSGGSGGQGGIGGPGGILIYY